MSQHKIHPVQQDIDSGKEVDLVEVWLVVVKNKKMIVKSFLGAIILTSIISLILPNIYHAEVLLAPVNADGEKSGLSSALGAAGGLASMAGLSTGGGNTEENLAVLQAREFLWQFARTMNYMPIFFESKWDAKNKRWEDDDPKKQPGQWDVYRFLIKDKRLEVSQDVNTNLVTVAIEWKDAAIAAKLANDLVEQLNQYLAKQSIARSERNLKFLNDELAHTQVEEMRKVLFDMMASEQKNAMMASTQKNEFAFKVLDPAAEPDKKIKPKRLLIVLFSSLFIGVLSIIYAFIKEGLIKRRELNASLS
ncbi:MAG: Wzz/FepE/Etk N-terminal domain-containing protein [Gallionella sp.]|nr:Wzz/FepE/Etk N-terminal domain-containing protein [Gallionella sp.]MDD4959643.1 Wzz/FepE/Etk N-terminal domain-containing protein [Gallionella sp.]